VNWYPKFNEISTGKSGEQASLIATPGLSLLATIGTGPIRGSFVASNGFLYVVSGEKAFHVDKNYSTIFLGNLRTSTGQVDFADNGSTLVIVDGDNGYWHTFSSFIITRFTGSPWLGSKTVNFVDGYFLFSDPGTSKFYISSLNSVTLDALDFSFADGAPDNIVATLVNHREVWLFGSDSIETWYNSGNADFPFQRIGGGLIEIGCAAPFSVAKINKTTLWIGRSKEGTGIIYAAQGLSPQRISTHAIEYAIQGYGDISDASAWTYQENGHFFYVLNFTNANTTWVYDLTTTLWSERAYFEGGNFKRHRASSHTFAYNKHTVGDFESGKIYELSSNNYTDNGEEIRRMRSAPHISSDLKRISYHSFQIDTEAGTGLIADTQGNDPEMVLQFSDDGGHTWSNEKWAKLGKIGARSMRTIWRRLGASRDRVFRIFITDPIRTNLIGVEIEIEKLGS